MDDTVMTPQRVADMPFMEFLEKVKAANVSDIKLMSDLLKMASAEVQMTFYQLKLDTQLKDQDYTTEDWNNFCDTIAQLGGLVSQITVKSDICSYYFSAKTPDCFKKDVPTENRSTGFTLEDIQ